MLLFVGNGSYRNSVRTLLYIVVAQLSLKGK
jgi:hypothetical protein